MGVESPKESENGRRIISRMGVESSVEWEYNHQKNGSRISSRLVVECSVE